MAITLGDQERSPIQGIFEKCKDLNSIRDKMFCDQAMTNFTQE